MDVLEKITTLAQGMTEALGLDLVDVELFRAGRRRMLRVYIGKSTGVSVEDCTRISRDLSAVLDAENWLGDETYVLEVSSPGLGRPFKTLADWRRNLGREVHVTCREKVANRFEHIARLKSVDETNVVLEKGSVETRIPLTQVALAKLEIKLT